MTSLSLTSRVRANDKVLFQEIGDEAVLLNLDTGVYFGVDEVGMAIWKSILKNGQISSVSEDIGLEFEVDFEKRNRDVLEFAKQLLDKNLIYLSE